MQPTDDTIISAETSEQRKHKRPPQAPVDGPFFMIYMPEGGRKPQFRHGSYPQASNEADRLAKMYPAKTFVILQAVEVRKADMNFWSIPVKSHRVGEGEPSVLRELGEVELLERSTVVESEA